MKYRIIPVTPFQQNCSLIWCEKTLKAAVIDPGGDVEQILAVAKAEGVTIEKIFLTHAHIDHVGGTAQLAQAAQAHIEGPHLADQFWLDKLPEQAQMFGFAPVSAFSSDRYLQQGDHIEIGEESLLVLHTPGHTPGHVVFYSQASQIAFVGDVLFAGSIGRTDFPQSDHDALIHSIRTQLWPLGDDVTFVPGHGQNSTFAVERQSNPFVADQLFT